MVILINKLGNLYNTYSLNEEFLIFQTVLEFAINTYVEKSVTSLFTEADEEVKRIINANPFQREEILQIEQFGELIRGFRRNGFRARRRGQNCQQVQVLA